MSDLDKHFNDVFNKTLNRSLEVTAIHFDKSKCTTVEEFKQAEKEFNELYNSSPEMKKLIDSWNP